MFRLGQLPRTLVAALRDLKHEKPEVRASATRDLAPLHAEHPEEVTEAFQRAAADQDPQVRKAALEGLGDVQAKDSLETILDAMEDRDVGVRQAAIVALGSIGAEAAADKLEKALRDPRPEVRFQAVMAYPRVAPTAEDAWSALVRATRDEDDFVAHIAFRMAEEVADRFKSGIDDRVVESAAIRVKKSAPKVRAVAAIILGGANDDRGDKALVGVVSGKIATSELDDVTAAVEMAGERKLTAASEALAKRAFGGLLGLRRDPCAWHARTALARMGDERATSEILRDLRGFSRHTRTLAVAAAGRARLVTARPLIEAMQGNKSRAEPNAVESALELIDEEVQRSRGEGRGDGEETLEGAP